MICGTPVLTFNGKTLKLIPVHFFMLMKVKKIEKGKKTRYLICVLV
jgi:hypothetical protein